MLLIQSLHEFLVPDLLEGFLSKLGLPVITFHLGFQFQVSLVDSLEFLVDLIFLRLFLVLVRVVMLLGGFIDLLEVSKLSENLLVKGMEGVKVGLLDDEIHGHVEIIILLREGLGGDFLGLQKFNG